MPAPRPVRPPGGVVERVRADRGSGAGHERGEDAADDGEHHDHDHADHEAGEDQPAHIPAPEVPRPGEHVADTQSALLLRFMRTRPVRAAASRRFHVCSPSTPATLAAPCVDWTRKEFLKLAGLAAAGTSLAAAGCGSQQAADPPASSRLRLAGSPGGGRPRAGRRAEAPAPRTSPPPPWPRWAAWRRSWPRAPTSSSSPTSAPATTARSTRPPPIPTSSATLVSLCRRAGASRVRVMDLPFGSPAEEAYRVSGIQEAVEKAGGEMQIMAPAGFREYRIPDGRDLTSWPIYADVLACDVLIDVPIAKDHGATRLSLAGKNLLGVILDAGEIHTNIGQRTADLMSVVPAHAHRGGRRARAHRQRAHRRRPQRRRAARHRARERRHRRRRRLRRDAVRPHRRRHPLRAGRATTWASARWTSRRSASARSRV